MEKINIELLENKSLQTQIHQLKEQFIGLFASMANQIPDAALTALHPAHKGKKISKGNELQHCPYQVLDIVRDFDKKNGFNIRFLNWWGHGLYIIIYHGAAHTPCADEYHNYLSKGFALSLTGSPWDYKGMIIHKMYSTDIPFEQIPTHIDKLKHLQFIKRINYNIGVKDLEKSLMEEWRTIKKFKGFE
ncbi:hypothetical protein KZP23_20835 [Echinicola marina]|uniref:hypothetical protein n=1 Tax=Echinicola marina TaxID=2859768 RepID=UPI001CF60BD6|nr:hypothetical protein [Echinicola marina]UCS93079.1 hypothetical protein KZP23_20835 [Echinicola marina]